MKKFLLSGFVMFALNTAMAQSPYISVKDAEHPDQHILNGIITKYALQNDPSYKWYNSSQSSYAPAADVVNTMKAAIGNKQIIVFGGTWCEDTQFILPKFFKLQEQSAFPDNAVSFFAVDRNKKTIGGITDALKIINVPTIIVLKDGKEIGRVVEYGKTGQWDKELMELLK
jgi:thiol-disulfide isomerase/thioredoxin